jgi:hypothetical protein
LDVLPAGGIIENPVYEPFVCYMKVEVTHKCQVGINLDSWDFVPGVAYIVDNGVYDILNKAKYIKCFQTTKRSDSHADGRKKRVSLYSEG